MKRTVYLVLFLQLSLLLEVRAIEFWNFAPFTNGQKLLLQQVDTCKHPQLKAELFAQLSRVYQAYNLRTAMAFADSSLTIARRAKSVNLILLSQQLKAECLILSGQLKSGRQALNACIETAKKAKFKHQLPYLYCWHAFSLITENDLEKVLPLLDNAKKQFEENKDAKGILLTDYLQTLSLSQLNLQNLQIKILTKILNQDSVKLEKFKNNLAFDIAYARLRLERQFTKELPPYLQTILTHSLTSHNHYNCGRSYNLIAEYYLRGGLYNESLRYYLKSADYFQNVESPLMLGTIYTNVSHVLQQLNKQQLNLLYTTKALKERQLAGHISGIISSYMNLGFAQINNGDVANAESNYLVGYRLAATYNAEQLQQQLADKLYVINKSRNNSKKALEYLKVKGQLFENSNSKFNSGIISHLKTNYEQHLHQHLLSINQEKINYSYYWIALVFMILLVVLWGVYHGNKYIRYSKQERFDRSREMLLRLQMNPHFVFNALLAVQSFIFKKNSENAVKFLDNFSGLIQRVLKTTRSELIPLSEELEITNKYLTIQKARFGEKFSYSIEIDPNIKPSTTLVSPMLLQPFLENAIEHAFAKMQNNGILIIKYLKKAEKLLVEVQDNGPGTDIEISSQQPFQTKNPFSMAIKITSERISILNRRQPKDDSTFRYFNLYDDNGAIQGLKVLFVTPYITLLNENT